MAKQARLPGAPFVTAEQHCLHPAKYMSAQRTYCVVVQTDSQLPAKRRFLFPMKKKKKKI